MSALITMATLADTLKKLMEQWEEALQVTIKTGYWKDTEACDAVIREYGKHVEEVLRSGQFSGDARKAMSVWTDLTTAEADYRATQMKTVRDGIPPPHPDTWWVALECHPYATDEQVKAAFREKMKSCHPDRVAGMAPEIQKLANEIAQKLTVAMRQFEAQRR